MLLNDPETADAGNTDYVIRSARRSAGGLVTYVVVDELGRVTHVAMPFHLSVPEFADPIIRRTVAQHPRRGNGQ